MQFFPFLKHEILPSYHGLNPSTGSPEAQDSVDKATNSFGGGIFKMSKQKKISTLKLKFRKNAYNCIENFLCTKIKIREKRGMICSKVKHTS